LSDYFALRERLQELICENDWQDQKNSFALFLSPYLRHIVATSTKKMNIAAARLFPISHFFFEVIEQGVGF